MKFKVKDMDIATGDIQVAILNEKDAMLYDLHHVDRIHIKKGNKKTTAVLDIAESSKAVPPGQIGLFEEVLDALNAKQNDTVEIKLAKKPISVTYIKQKLDGKELTYPQILEITKDIVNNKLTAIELTSYITANYTNGMSRKEITAVTKAMTVTGTTLKFNHKPIADLHCIGGVPGNRTTMIIVPILAAAGLTVPKTSSRAITSPAGTADTMEVLCSVTLPIQKLKKTLEKTNAFIIWGGAVNLAPADDKIIKIEHPLSIDAEGQMLASIMAKKASVSATHLLIDIPIGKGTKVENLEGANHLKEHFEELGQELGIKVEVITTDGTQPIGNGIGPALEARDCLWLFENDPRAPKDLKEKSIMMTAKLLELTGKTKPGQGKQTARNLLNNGLAHKKMIEIIKAQEGKITSSEQISIGKETTDYTAKKTGNIEHIDNIAIAKIARAAGAPLDPGAGLYLHKHAGDTVKKGDKLFTIHAMNKQKLKYAKETIKELEPVMIK